MHMPNKPTFIDVFSGCGGLSAGLLAAGWQGVFAVEKTSDAFLTLQHNLITPNPNTPNFAWPTWLEQKPMTVSDLLSYHKKSLRTLKGKIDLLAGGPPCQGFSTAGKRDPNDPRNSLTEEYLQVVKLIKPRFLLIENVKGFNSVFRARGKSSKPYSHVVKEKLEKLGYIVYSGMVCCSHFGVPQNRNRFIMLAIRKKDPVLKTLHASNPIDLLNNNAQAFKSNKGLHSTQKVSVTEALSDLETVGKKLIQHIGPYKGFKQLEYTEPKNLSQYQKLMRQGMQKESLNSLRITRHTAPVVERFKNIQLIATLGRGLSPTDREILGIKKHSITPLHPHRPSATVTTLPDDILHYSEPRILTVRENARLQSFPDWFEFKGNYTTGGKQRKVECPRYTQVGNAVPPLLGEAIGRHIINLITNKTLTRDTIIPESDLANTSQPIVPVLPTPVHTSPR